jgi:hypothetical protein
MLHWAGHIGKKVDYLVVKNLKDGSDFGYLHDTEEGREFIRDYSPTFVTMPIHHSDIRAELDNRSLSVRQALEAPPERRGPLLGSTMGLARLRTYLNTLNRELEQNKTILLP